MSGAAAGAEAAAAAEQAWELLRRAAWAHGRFWRWWWGLWCECGAQSLMCRLQRWTPRLTDIDCRRDWQLMALGFGRDYMPFDVPLPTAKLSAHLASNTMGVSLHRTKEAIV